MNTKKTLFCFFTLFLFGSNFINTVNGTRAVDIQQVILDFAAAEGKSISLVCAINGDGPGFFTPIGVARGYRSVARAMYNAWSAYDNGIASMDFDEECTIGSPSACSEEECISEKEEAITCAAFFIIEYLLPERTISEDLVNMFLTDFGVDVTQFSDNDSPCGIGHDVAQCLIGELQVDGSNQEGCYADISNYMPPNPPVDLTNQSTVQMGIDENNYKLGWTQIVRPPFINEPRGYLLPHAGRIKSYAYDHSVHAPPLPDNDTLHQQFLDIIDIQSQLEDNNGEFKVNAEYWADGPKTTLPPGHWMEIAIELLVERESYNLDQSVLTLYLVGNAVYDAGIAVWEDKKYYSLVRPGTYIPMFTGVTTTYNNQYQGPYCPLGTIQAYQWQPYQAEDFVTPPFPEYVSGHSGFSASAATVMGLWTGSDTISGGGFSVDIAEGSSAFEPYCNSSGLDFNGNNCTYRTCDVNGTFTSENNYEPSLDVTLGPWSTFSDIALDAGYSRLYGGIHIAAGNDEGIALGNEVGKQVFAKFILITGRQFVGDTPSSESSDNSQSAASKLSHTILF